MSAPLVQLRDVTTAAGGRALLQGVSLEVYPGEALLVQGPNGSGKTALLRLLAGEAAPVQGERVYGLGGGRQISAVRARQLLNVVGPDSEAAWLLRDWPQPVRDVLLSALQEDRWAHQEAAQAARLAEVAAMTGLDGLLERDFRTLSHGQRRRVGLARALMPSPELLLLDELTDGLSPGARRDLGEVLRRVHASGTAVVLATHRPAEVPDLGWTAVRVEGGRVTREGAESAKESGHPQSDTFGYAPGPARLRLPEHPGQSPQPLVCIQDAEVYRGGVRALGPLSWTWETGQHWLVTGDNGSGKSTLTRLIYGEFRPAQSSSSMGGGSTGGGGTVTRPCLPRDVISERRRAFGIVGAELGIRQRRGWTGAEILGSAFSGTEGFAEPLSPEQAAQLQALAEHMELTGVLDRDARSLSQGQLRRLLLARAALHRPRMLLLDEGLDFVDARSRALFLDLLPELTAGGTHVLLVAHRPEDAPGGMTHHLHLDAGRVAWVGEWGAGHWRTEPA